MLGRLLSATIVAGVIVVASAAGPVAAAECPPTSNLAECAVATADSENAFTEQTAAKAIDGVADGYPGDHTAEWATVGGKEGSTLTLTWPAPQRIASVVLADRPNEDDDITGGTLTFSDGSTVLVPALPSSGEPLAIAFPWRDTDTLVFTVTSVSDTTYNIGLSEFDVRAPQEIASLLGTERVVADAGGVASILPRAVSTVYTADGIRLVRVELEIESLAGAVAPRQSWFTMLSPDWVRYAPVDDPADDAADPIGDVALGVGEVLTATVHFEIPSDGSGFRLAFAPVLGADPTAIWSLNSP